LKILSIEDAKSLKFLKQLLHRSRKIDFIEQFNEKLLVKQEDENFQILVYGVVYGYNFIFLTVIFW